MKMHYYDMKNDALLNPKSNPSSGTRSEAKNGTLCKPDLNDEKTPSKNGFFNDTTATMSNVPRSSSVITGGPGSMFRKNSVPAGELNQDPFIA